MKIEIPDQIVTEQDTNKFLIELACLLYNKGKVSTVKCTRIAGLSRDEFHHELWLRKIPRQYDIEDFEEDMKVVNDFDKW